MRKATLVGLASAAVLICCGLLLATNNPAIEVDVPPAWGYDEFECLAPYDTVLNDADNSRGGEPPPNIEEIANRCEEAGRARFRLAMASGIAGVAAGIGSLTYPVAARRRGRSGR